jgi:hypothetical protein
MVVRGVIVLGRAAMRSMPVMGARFVKAVVIMAHCKRLGMHNPPGDKQGDKRKDHAKHCTRHAGSLASSQIPGKDVRVD